LALEPLIPEILKKGMGDGEADIMFLKQKLTQIIEETYQFRSDLAFMLKYIGVNHDFSSSRGYGDKVFWKDFWPVFRDQHDGVAEIYDSIVSDLWEINIEDEITEEYPSSPEDYQ